MEAAIVPTSPTVQLRSTLASSRRSSRRPSTRVCISSLVMSCVGGASRRAWRTRPDGANGTSG